MGLTKVNEKVTYTKPDPKASATRLALVGAATGLREVKEKAEDYIINLAFKKNIEGHLRKLKRLHNVNKIHELVYNIQLKGEGDGVVH